MATFQVWLVHALSTASPAVAAFMRSKWGWPIAESLHFIGLCLLLGAIGVFDLRLLGVAKRIPIIALHKLIPWGIGGFAVNVITGSMFLMTEPDQYVYNPSFQFKLLFIACAGLNALMFYLIPYRRIGRLPPGAPAPQAARVVAAVSLTMWLAVIVCGRMITFYRPVLCGPGGPGFLAECIPAGNTRR
jgi:hypothetical protein